MWKFTVVADAKPLIVPAASITWRTSSEVIELAATTKLEMIATSSNKIVAFAVVDAVLLIEMFVTTALVNEGTV